MFQSTPAQLDPIGTFSSREMGVPILEADIEPDVDCRVLAVPLGPLGAYGLMVGRSKVVSSGHAVDKPAPRVSEWTDCWPAGILESSTCLGLGFVEEPACNSPSLGMIVSVWRTCVLAGGEVEGPIEADGLGGYRH